MKLYTTRDSEENITGFKLITDCCIDEDLFIANLPANMKKEEVQISIVPDGISITSGIDGTRSFKIPPDELNALKAYLENDETKVKIEHDGISLIAIVRFMTEPTKEASIKV